MLDVIDMNAQRGHLAEVAADSNMEHREVDLGERGVP
jgi:hypothetical protein